MKKTHGFLSIATIVGILGLPAVAFAHEDPAGTGEKRPTEGSASAEEGTAESREEKEPDWEVSGDFVFGATTLEVLDEGRPTRVELAPSNKFDSMRATTLSLVAGVERKLGERFKLGARLPVIDTDLRSRDAGADPRSEFLVGNIELEAALILAHGKNWEVEGTLELALPTAGGKSPPTAEEVEADPGRRYNYRAIDRFAGGRAANFARGSYESALFESGHIGVIPKIGAKLHSGKLTIAPVVKVENLFDVTGDEAESYIGELVAGVRAGYLVTSHIEPGIHVWTNITYTQHDPLEAVVVEPNVRVPLGRITPQAGVLIPVAGSLFDDKTFGVRLAIAGEL